MSTALVPLGPWPRGINAVAPSDSPVFDVAGKKRPYLREAVNVDLNRDGVAAIRSGTTNRRTGTAYKALTVFHSRLIVQDGGSIYSVDPEDAFAVVELVSGLSSSLAIKFHEFGGRLYWLTTEARGIIESDFSASHWGLAVPAAPTLNTTSGDLAEGRYIVAVTLEDANGEVSGLTQHAAIVTSGSQDITVTVTSPDANATHANIFVSPPNQKALFWNQRVAISALPATIDDAFISDRIPKTRYMRGPIPGSGLFSYLGFLLTFTGNTFFRSKGHTPNLFYPKTEYFSLPETIRAGAGLTTGFYVATDGGMYWVSGSNPVGWRAKKLDTAVYGAGSLVLPGEKIPQLRTSDPVALFASADGLVVGLPSGEIKYLTDNRLSVPSEPTTTNIVYVEQSEFEQLLMLIT